MTSGNAEARKTGIECKSPNWFRDIPRRCGKCGGCVRHREWLWYSRCVAEGCFSKKVWFCTFTFPPAGDDGYGQIKRYWKRVRKAGHKFKYVVTREFHKSGRRHYHAILFDHSGITWRDLNGARLGIGNSVFRLAERDDIGYVLKYAMKDGDRPKSSNGLGNGKSVELVAAALSEFPGAVVTEIAIKSEDGVKVVKMPHLRGPRQILSTDGVSTVGGDPDSVGHWSEKTSFSRCDPKGGGEAALERELGVPFGRMTKQFLMENSEEYDGSLEKGHENEEFDFRPIRAEEVGQLDEEGEEDW